MSFLGHPSGRSERPTAVGNPKLSETHRPSFWDLESKPLDGVKKFIQKSEKGYAKDSWTKV
jgi:hypothetical protein